MKTLAKLTLKSLLMNKTRTLVTIVGIMLSAALITVVAGVFTSAQATLISSAVRETGDYDIVFDGQFSNENIKKIGMNRDVQDVAYKQSVGMAEVETTSKYRRYALVTALNKTAFDKVYVMPLESGRYPKNSEEIVLSPSFARYTSGKYKIGEKVTLKLGNRVKTDEDNSKNILINAAHGNEINKYIYMDENYYGEGNEYIEPEFEKTYTIVGVLSDLGSELVTDKSSSACMDVFTLSDDVDNLQKFNYLGLGQNSIHIRINLTDDAESDPINVITQMSGCDADFVKTYIDSYGERSSFDEDGYFMDAETREMFERTQKTIHSSNSFGISGFSLNVDLLRFKGIGISDTNMGIVFGFTGLIIFIIMASSIFIIRNSISISVTEKTKLYGMLSSIGTTPRQIRRNVLFESFLLGLVGIPLGICLGVGVTACLMRICDYIAMDNLNGNHLLFSVPFIAVVAAVLLSALTIYLSSISIAISASKISPIAAIRGNRDVRIKRGKKVNEKIYRTPKIIKKLFGTGGSIAYKNLKRSKTQYRTTVISIVLSVSVYITVFSFVESALDYTRRYYDSADYNMSVVPFSNIEDEKITAADIIGSDLKLSDQIGALSDVQKLSYDMKTINYLAYFPKKNIYIDKSKNFSFNRVFRSEEEITEDTFKTVVGIMTMDDKSYKDFLETLGIDASEIKGKGILNNSNTYYIERGENEKAEEIPSKFLKDPVGSKINLDDIENLEQNSGKHDISIEIGAVYDNDLIKENQKKLNPALTSTVDTFPYIIVDMNTYKELIKSKMTDTDIFLYSKNATKTEEDIKELTVNSGAFINNYEYTVKSINAVVTILEIFIYGFIIVIAAIGLTNIFNTITTNMSLRRKEFAMLQSVGMTRKEFRRMVDLESIMYAAKSLVIALPLGIFGGLAVNYIFNSNLIDDKMAYQFPWLAILISVAVVVCVVWLIMTFSLSRLRKQNIIETIRNDNI